MPIMKARIISEAKSDNRVILAPSTSPAIICDGSLDIICGACGTMLIKHARPFLAIQNMLIRCPCCHQCNDTEQLKDNYAPLSNKFVGLLSKTVISECRS